MASIYVYLGLLALIFSLFGFLIHAFYFVPQREKHLIQEAAELRRNLEQKQTSVKEAREEAARSSEIIRTLEQQVQQRNSEMETLRGLVSRQDEEIKILQKDAEIIRMAVSGTGKAADLKIGVAPPQPGMILEGSMGRIRGVSAPDQTMEPNLAGSATLHPFEPREQTQSGPASENQAQGEIHQQSQPDASGGAASPGWKENLESILGILDAMEREVQK